MASYKAAETAKIAVTVNDKFATFDGGAQEFYLVSDADCFVDFDEVAQANSSLLIKANLAPARIVIKNGNTTTVHAITASSTANLYILAVRN